MPLLSRRLGVLRFLADGQAGLLPQGRAGILSKQALLCIGALAVCACWSRPYTLFSVPGSFLERAPLPGAPSRHSPGPRSEGSRGCGRPDIISRAWFALHSPGSICAPLRPHSLVPLAMKEVKEEEECNHAEPCPRPGAAAAWRGLCLPAHTFVCAAHVCMRARLHACPTWELAYGGRVRCNITKVSWSVSTNPIEVACVL